jgi:hypothetical protein
MTELDQLIAVENIKKLKASYWYAMDTKQFDLIRPLFTRDAIVDFRSGRDLKPGDDYEGLAPAEQALANGDPMVVQGNDAIADFIRAGVETWVTVHQGAAPIIDILGPDDATGIWPIFDLLDNGSTTLRGYGHYHDRYRREDGVWRIASFRISRLRLEGQHPRHEENAV